MSGENEGKQRMTEIHFTMPFSYRTDIPHVNVYSWSTVLFFLLQIISVTPSNSACDESTLYSEDCNALFELFNFTNRLCFIPDVSLQDGSSTDPCGSDRRIECEKVNDDAGKFIVISLNLQGNPEQVNHCDSSLNALGKLKNLTSLNLSYYPLNGSLISSFPILSNLKSLTLTNNGINNIPKDFGNLVNLQHLDLSGNKFNSQDSSLMSLKSLSNLKELNLCGNGLLVFPRVLKDMFSLTHLDLSNNYLSGSIPNWLQLLHNLQYLNLQSNMLSGQIPKFLNNISEVYVSGNSFCGDGIGDICQPFPFVLLGTIIGTASSAIICTICIGVMLWHMKRRGNLRSGEGERTEIVFESMGGAKEEEPVVVVDSRQLIPVHINGTLIGMAHEIEPSSSNTWESNSSSSDDEESDPKNSEERKL